MDPVTGIVTALAAGAAAGLKPTAEQVIKDAYQALKNIIKAKFPKVDVSQVELKPSSKTKRAAVAEDLNEAGAAHDGDVILAAQHLSKVLEQSDPQLVESVGINLEQLHAAGNIVIEGVSGFAQGIIGKDLSAKDVVIKNITARSNSPEGPDPNG